MAAIRRGVIWEVDFYSEGCYWEVDFYSEGCYCKLFGGVFFGTSAVCPSQNNSLLQSTLNIMKTVLKMYSESLFSFLQFFYYKRRYPNGEGAEVSKRIRDNFRNSL